MSPTVEINVKEYNNSMCSYVPTTCMLLEGDGSYLLPLLLFFFGHGSPLLDAQFHKFLMRGPHMGLLECGLILTQPLAEPTWTTTGKRRNNVYTYVV